MALNLTSLSSQWAANPNDISEINIANTSIPIFSPGLCDEFPQLQSLSIFGGNIEEIKKDAFRGCGKLTKLSLEFNKFKKIDQNAFKGLVSLRELYISGGNIPELNLNLTDLKQLKRLEPTKLGITKIDANMFKGLENLESVRLAHNELFDLDIEGILKFAPKLAYADILDNNFECDRISAILDKNSRKINFDPLAYSYRGVYWVGPFDVECLSKDLWKFRYSKTFPDESNKEAENDRAKVSTQTMQQNGDIR